MTTVSTEPMAAAGPTNGDQELPVGTTVGEYQIEAVLGRGGFGTVYRGIHPLIGKQVAIKVLARKYAGDDAIISRFAAEARAVNEIRHRNIIDIFQFSVLPDGRPYYVMECLDGEPLDAYLAAHGPMSLVEALPILKAIGRALDAAHAKGIAHRDLKPENIFLARADGELFPKLLDFGIAKLLGVEDSDSRHRTATGVPIGTPYYMSPEQCRGKDVDQRTDIYSFGILMYRTLTGTYPIEGDDYVELLYKQVNEEAPPASSRNPNLPTTVDAAIAWMMRKDPAQRPRTLAEAMAAFDGVVSKQQPAIDPLAQTVPPHAVSTIKSFDKRPKPRSTVWIGAGLVLVAGAFALVLFVKTNDNSSSASHAVALEANSAKRTGAPPQEISSSLQQGSGAGGGPGGPADQVTSKPQAQPAPVVITLTHVPRGATIELDGKPVDGLALDAAHGTATFPVKQSDEPHAITLTKKGFAPRTLRFSPHEAQSLDATLSPVAPRPDPTRSGPDYEVPKVFR